MRRRGKITLSAFISLVLVGLIIFICLEVAIAPIAMSLFRARVMAIATKALNEAVAESVTQTEYDDLMQIYYDSAGTVSSIQTNTAEMNLLATNTALVAQGKIAEIGNQRVSITLGQAIGSQFFYQSGPLIFAHAIPAGAVTSQFLSEFSSAGINQTRHRLYIKLTATMSIIMPTRSAELSATTQVPIAETIIVGKVPDSYLSSDRYEDILNLVP